MSNQLSPRQRRFQYALIITGVVTAVTAILTFILAALVLMLVGVQAGNPFAMYAPEFHLAPSMFPQGALGGGAWLLLVTAYASLLVGIPAFAILYLGGADAN